MRFAVIGTGFGAQHLAWLSECPRADVRFIAYDRDVDRAEKLAKQFGVAEVTHDPLAVITSAAVDAVAVATPPGTHETLATAALEAGLVVVSDKPLAVDAAAAGRLSDLAQRAGATTAVTFQWRNNPALRRLRDLVAHGELGRIVHVDLEMRHDFLAGRRTAWPWRHRRAAAGAGALADQGVHLFDQLRWLVPGPWAVTAGTASVVTALREGDDGTVECETDDVADVLLRSTTAQARVFVSRVSVAERFLRARVLGSGGQAVVTASADDGSASIELMPHAGAPAVVRFGPSTMNPYAPLLAGDADIADFTAACEAQLLLDAALERGCGTPLVAPLDVR